MEFTDSVKMRGSVEYQDRFPNVIETDRLTLRGPISEHVTLGELFAFHTGKHADKMCEPMNIEPYETVEDARDKYETYNAEWEEGSAAYYAMFEKNRSNGYETDFCGFAFVDFEWETRKAYIGIWLHPAVWGQSYSAERAEALVEMVFNSSVGEGIEVVEIFFEPSNTKSESAVNKYVNKLGGEFQGIHKNKLNMMGRDAPVDMKLYQITREEYIENKRD